MARSIQTSMVPSARSHLGSCILTRLETGKRASSGLDTAVSHKSGVCGRTKLEPHGTAAAMTLLVASNFLVTAARSRVELWLSCGGLAERSRRDPGTTQDERRARVSILLSLAVITRYLAWPSRSFCWPSSHLWCLSR